MLKFEERLLPIFNLISKFSGAILMFSGYLLCANEKWLVAPLENFKNEYLSELWLSFSLSISITLNYFLRELYSVSKNNFNDWRTKKKMEKDEKIKQEKELNILVKRLGSLNCDELIWITYCVHYNYQTISASSTNGIANSLCSKNILNGGLGNVMSIPYTIPDKLWNYLQKNSHLYIPANMNNNEKRDFENKLQRFRTSLKPS